MNAHAQAGVAIPYSQVATVDAHGECRDVKNQEAGTTRVVFAGSQGEWQSFRDYPNGLLMESCATCAKDAWVMKPFNLVSIMAATATAIAVSDDGQTMFVSRGTAGSMSFLAKPLISTNGGATWQESGALTVWTDAAISADGNKMLGSAWPKEYLYVSTNKGATWVAHASKQDAWNSVAMSADGTKLFGLSGGALFRSVDGGTTWTHNTSVKGWGRVRASSNANIVAAAISSGRIHISTDGGATWTPRADTKSWLKISVSSNGQKMAALTLEGELYVSTDTGTTWTLKKAVSEGYGYAVHIADDGAIAMTAGGYANMNTYLSKDGGNTWETQFNEAIIVADIAQRKSDQKIILLADLGIYTKECLEANQGTWQMRGVKFGASCTGTCSCNGLPAASTTLTSASANTVCSEVGKCGGPVFHNVYFDDAWFECQ